MSYFSNVIPVGLAEADVYPSQEIIAKPDLSSSLIRRDDMNAP